MLIFINIFWIFKGSKHAILGKNHRQGLRSGSRNRAWTKTFFWCILLRDKASKIPGSLIFRFLRRPFFHKFSLIFFGFLSLLLARSRRAVANLEERVKKFIHTAFVWPVEVGKILMHFLIVYMNKLDLIRFLPYPRKIFFCQFSRFAVVV